MSVTYQLQDRLFKLESVTDWTFPSDVKIEVCFKPQEQFGTNHGFSRTAVFEKKAQFNYNANTGRGLVRPEIPLDPLEVRADFVNTTLHVKGNKLLVGTRCTSVTELHQTAYHLYSFLPRIMNVYFIDPVCISSVTAEINGKASVWEHSQANFAFHITTTENQEKELGKALTFYGSKLTEENYRLTTALSYLHKACRLIAVGNGPWEFMSEAVLNLTKSLEVMFNSRPDGSDGDETESRDRIRAGLKNIGVEKETVERVFVPVLILRSHFDVAHPQLGRLDKDDLQLIYTLLANAEAEFRDLFRRLVEEVTAGKAKVPPYKFSGGPSYDSSMRGFIERLRKNPPTREGIKLEKRVIRPEWGGTVEIHKRPKRDA